MKKILSVVWILVLPALYVVLAHFLPTFWWWANVLILVSGIAFALMGTLVPAHDAEERAQAMFCRSLGTCLACYAAIVVFLP